MQRIDTSRRRRQSAGRFRLPGTAGDRWALAARTALLVVLALTFLRPTLPRWVDRLNVVFLLGNPRLCRSQA